MKDQCPLEQVDCPFHYAGCETQLPRKDMPERMRENFTHLTLLATFTQKLSIENQRLVKEIQQLQHKQQITEEKVCALKEGVEKQHPLFPVDFH